MNYCIYFIQKKDDNRIYVGQTKNYNQRWARHKKCASPKSKQYIRRALAKYGIDAFDFYILQPLSSREEANEMEIFWINILQTRNKKFGFNIAAGGKYVLDKKIFSNEQEIDICEKYVNEQLSITKLGKHFNCSAQKIFQILKDHDIAILGNKTLSKGKHYSLQTEFKTGQIPHNKLFTLEQEKEICSRYLNEKLSIIQLANIYRCHDCVISRLLDKHNINKRKRYFSLEQIKEICEKYVNEKLSTLKLAMMYDCKKSSIRNMLVRNNIPRRNNLGQ